MLRLLNSSLYHPDRSMTQTPADAGLAYRDLAIPTEDGEQLNGWLVAAQRPPMGHVVLCHGNAGNIGNRLLHAALLSAAGFDVLLFDYRGYGRSSGSPSEEGLYRDARAARTALLGESEVDPGHVLYLGESLGGAVALALALDHPPRGLILQSTFTSVRDMARAHYPFLPATLIPDAYPSLGRIGDLRAPLLVLHGDRDEVVPLAHGQALFNAASGPKEIRIFPGLGHNDLVARAGAGYADAIALWVTGLGVSAP
jgi:pimeloyl-ACP methyl ester carboxylesterase